MKKFLLQSAKDLDSGYFSFVMATGIVSIAAFLQGMELIASILFGLNKIAYLVLIVLMTVRCFAYPEKIFFDMTAPSRAPSFFTITAGTCILGTEFVLLSQSYLFGTVLLTAGFFFWAILLYSFFSSLVVAGGKASFEEGLNGGWLIFVVGTQALAIISVLVGAGRPGHHPILLLTAASLHAAANALYAVFIVLILRRLMFLDMSPEKLTQRYWITMGAAAVSTLAGAQIILHSGAWAFFQDVLPALKWVTFVFWSVATWWIPLVVILVIWRYGCRRFPAVYDVEHWSMVFPLGMYTVCSYQLGKAADLIALSHIARYFVYVALIAWAAAFIGLVKKLVRTLARR